MTKITKVLFLVLFLFQNVFLTSVQAAGLKQAGASLLLPTTGQAMNGQLGTTKTKVMAGLEVGLVTTMAVLGTAAGGGVVWFAAGPLIANHLWSSVDAYRNARKSMVLQERMPQLYMDEQPSEDAQRILAYSKERRSEANLAYESDLRQRIARAGQS